MGTTQPIRDKDELRQFMEYYQTKKPNPRNYALLVMGLHTALRIGDILKLHWTDVFDFEKECFRTHLSVQEKKTGKQNVIALNTHIKAALLPCKELQKPAPEDYIFTKTTDYSTPLCRSQAFRIIKNAAEHALGESRNISCHSLRKTFGYHAWKQGTPPALLMDIYNHSSYRITKKYLGIGQDERDSLFLQIDI